MPKFQEVNNKSAAKPRSEVPTQQDSSLSYDNTYSATAIACDETSSCSYTIHSKHDYASSIQAEPEVEQYTYAHTSYWNADRLDYQSEDVEQNILCIGMQFNV